MSLDYPFYEELVRLRHRGAWWWIVGDRLYYLGLLPGLLAAPGCGFALIAGLFGYGWGWLGLAGGTLLGGAVVWQLGGALKDRAYRLAERDGIRPK